MLVLALIKKYILFYLCIYSYGMSSAFIVSRVMRRHAGVSSRSWSLQGFVCQTPRPRPAIPLPAAPLPFSPPSRLPLPPSCLLLATFSLSF